MDTKKKAVGCYVRVSTVGQNEAGQRAEINRWLSGNGIDPTTVLWFTDKKSGDNLNRPAFDKLQKAIFAGEVGTVCVYKLDRLSRKLREGLDVLCDWCDKSLRVVSVTQNIDFNGTLGKMLAAVLLGIAEMEQENRRERQRAGIEAAQRAGKYKGRRRGSFKADPAQCLALRDNGYSAPQIAEALHIDRVTAWRYCKIAERSRQDGSKSKTKAK
jgi:DNA invertase Pin-like site-specific DNA recombinase